jgi:DNA (cytosine-5)-methyltransferase 1
MRFVSWFAGIGGFDLGLERAGHTVVAHSEIDPYCRRVLERHWPGVPNLGDIRNARPEDVPDAELWTAGFPCEDISRAGRRAGLAGRHSGRWSDLLRAVRLVRPGRLLLENVATLCTRGLDRVAGDLAESGYDAEWDCLPAAAFGAPHIRDRIFVVAHPSSGRHGAPQAPLFAGRTRPIADPWWSDQPGIPRVDDGLPSRVERRRVMGRAVVPQVVEAIARHVWPQEDRNA